MRDSSHNIITQIVLYTVKLDQICAFLAGPTPEPVDNVQKSWGESSVAELANGSVVLTSRMGVAMSASSRWRAFAISHTGGQTWDKAGTFAADQPFDVGYVQVMDLIYSTAYQSTTKPAKHYICFAFVALPPPTPLRRGLHLHVGSDQNLPCAGGGSPQGVLGCLLVVSDAMSS